MRALLVTLTGCSQIFGLDAPSRTSDAPIFDDVMQPHDTLSTDVTIPVGTCIQKWRLGPVFPMPTLITEVSSPTDAETDPFLLENGLALYMQRGADIFVARRASTSATFGMPARVDELSDLAAPEAKIFVNADETRAFFASGRPGGNGGGIDLWRGAASNGANWSAVDQNYIGSLNTTGEEHDPFLSANLLEIYFAPIQNSTQTILYATRGSVSNDFGTPATLTQLDGVGAEADPTVTADGTVIVFTSTMSGTRELMYATRTTKNAAFSAPLVVPNLNGAASDFDPHVSADGCTVIFASERSGVRDIYTATML